MPYCRNYSGNRGEVEINFKVNADHFVKPLNTPFLVMLTTMSTTMVSRHQERASSCLGY